MEEFHHTLLSHPDFSHSPSDSLYILSQLILNMPRLEAIGNLLPDLIQFYNWLHTEGAHKIERDYALKNGLEDFISKMSPAMTLNDLYERLRGEISHYAAILDHLSVPLTQCDIFPSQFHITNMLELLEGVLVFVLVLLLEGKIDFMK